MIEDFDGSLVGTTAHGGTGYEANDALSGLGTIFKLVTNGTFTNLVFFAGTNGSLPSSVLRHGDGRLYGCTTFGGSTNDGSIYSGFGTVFRVDLGGTLDLLFSFNGTNGASPQWPSSLIRTRDDLLLGFTTAGGDGFTGSSWSGFGTMFQFLPNLSVLNIAWFANSNGIAPSALMQAKDGHFYGTTTGGGDGGHGTVFRVTASGVQTLVSFSGTNGSSVEGCLIQGMDNCFYGTTRGGGEFGKGTVFRLSVPLPPVFQSIAETNGSVVLSWESVAGQSYQLQCTTNLASWADVGIVIKASSGTTTATDTTVGSLSRFYRVFVLP